MDSASVTHVVGPDDTAAALGSGDLPVLGTPRLLAWCEEATVAAASVADNVRRLRAGQPLVNLIDRTAGY